MRTMTAMIAGVLFLGGTALGAGPRAPAAAAPSAAAPALPGGLVKVATVPIAGKAFDICLSGERAYVASSERLTVLDIADPAAPKVLGAVAVAGPCFGVAVHGDSVFLASPSAGVIAVDVSNPAAPKVLATLKGGVRTYDVAVKDNVLYKIDNAGVTYFDISDPAAPKEIGKFGLKAWRPPNTHKPVTPEEEEQNLKDLAAGAAKGGSYLTGLAVDGNHLFACEWAYGRLFAYDITDARKPVFMGTDFSSYLLRIAARGDDVFMLGACGIESGVYHVKLSAMTPTKAVRVTNDMGPTGFMPSKSAIDMGGIAVSANGRCVLYAGGKGVGEFHVVDVSDPAHMKDVASAPIGTHQVGSMQVMDLANRGEYIYLCAGALGLQVWRFPPLGEGTPPAK